ncbi:MAG: glycosyltransferase family 4 protein [Prosthecobacter sp.]|uniref:glycosyltransferase family 4 protein n=1 Tax=Prosthecobacter sp. TaxID=1965333 RepID=UPI0025E6DFBB|nr:glycosyltransferase family 4 protein [Prosthecobacter sp.]MCF7785450.1 glycosyltransferase family 4 protein [Prosthecobacter sp.]
MQNKTAVKVLGHAGSQAFTGLSQTTDSPRMVMASGVSASFVGRNVESSIHEASSLRHSSSGKPRLLWVGDALVPTGFATVTHAVLDHLRNDWEVIVSGVNYEGAAHDLPYRVMPARQDGDMWGMNRFQNLCTEFDPTVVVINNDWWNVAQFARNAPAGVPIIGYMPVDGGNLDGGAMAELNPLHAAVWYTDFGHRAAVLAGFRGQRHVIPHGIDAGVFQPSDCREARRQLGLAVPPDAFIVGNVNRNQPRKRLDLTIQIFAAWVKQHSITNAHLLLHCAQKDTGWDLRRVAAYYGVADRLILTGAEDIRDLQEASRLKYIYTCLDVQMTTTLGEGWGLTTMEGMACGIPQIVPDSSALGEWAKPAVKIPCSRTLINPEINTTGALVDEAPFVAGLQTLYQSKAARSRLAAEGLAYVRGEAFRWETVAQQFQELLAAAAPRQARRRQETQRRQFSSRP